MQDQVAPFLFQNRSCPLPGIGTLYLRRAGASGDFTAKTIASPKPFIEFTAAEAEPSALISYLAATNGSSKDDAGKGLERFCNRIKQELAAAQQVSLPSLGNFYADSNGELHFTEESLPESFVQPIYAERVVHPNDEHAILVGDKESTNTLMTEMLAPRTEARQNWWVWAIVLALVAFTLIALYFGISNNASSLGNAVKI